MVLNLTRLSFIITFAARHAITLEIDVGLYNIVTNLN